MRLPITLVFCAITGCAASAGVANDIAAAEQALTVAETLAADYTALPACGAGVPLLCSDPTIVAKLKSLDMTAYNAVKAAENNSGTITAAWTAISALTGAIPPAN